MAGLGTGDFALVEGLSGFVSSGVAQLVDNGRIDFEMSLRAGLAGGISGGVAGFYGSSYGIDRLITETLAGCASSSIAGGNCKGGAVSAFANSALAWANHEMRRAMIEDSRTFPGICDTHGNCLDNQSGESVGVNGDKSKLAGGRVNLDLLCDNGRCERDPVTGGWRRDGQGRVVMSEFDGHLNPINLNDLLDANPDWRSPMGGWQGGLGQFAFFDYAPDSLWDRIAESYAGPHDMLNSIIWYDKEGNIRAGISQTLLGKIGNVTNYLNVLLATPFAIPVLLPAGTIEAIREQEARHDKGNE